MDAGRRPGTATCCLTRVLLRHAACGRAAPPQHCHGTRLFPCVQRAPTCCRSWHARVLLGMTAATCKPAKWGPGKSVPARPHPSVTSDPGRLAGPGGDAAPSKEKHGCQTRNWMYGEKSLHMSKRSKLAVMGQADCLARRPPPQLTPLPSAAGGTNLTVAPPAARRPSPGHLTAPPAASSAPPGFPCTWGSSAVQLGRVGHAPWLLMHPCKAFGFPPTAGAGGQMWCGKALAIHRWSVVVWKGGGLGLKETD